MEVEKKQQRRICHLPSEWMSCGGLKTRWSAAGAIFRLNSRAVREVGREVPRMWGGDPLKLVKEMHTEAPTVPIGTIEPAGCPVYWRHWREEAQETETNWGESASSLLCSCCRNQQGHRNTHKAEGQGWMWRLTESFGPGAPKLFRAKADQTASAFGPAPLSQNKQCQKINK